ncbi:hypothetical protein GCM10008905_03650 [Clostridium malenominatum]|uniref:Type IV pilus assembly protein PilM n=1 Tax=Clostridium malenominatum TaxID=1539 RepID=A0ABP3TW22_9CLOT
MAKEKIVFRFNEDNIDIVLMKYSLKKSTLMEYKTLMINPSQGGAYNGESLINESKKFIEESKVKSRKAVAILGLDGVITRLVEVPYMKRKELKSFIKNNINDYFTVNIQEYYYDYRIVEISKDKVKKISLLLAVIPKIKLDDIHGYLQSLNVDTEKITIYPEALASLLQKRTEKSIAIVDYVKDVNNITILEGNKLFLNSTSHVDGDIYDNYDEIVDNISYFLNFYSTRHFGNRVDKIILLGKLAEHEEIIENLREQIDIPMEVGIRTVSKGALFSDVFAQDFKGIDFKKALKLSKFDEGTRDKRQYIALTVTLIILTITWIGVSNYLIRKKILSYDLAGITKRIESLGEFEEEHNFIMQERASYEKDKEFLRKVKLEGVNHIYYLEELRKGLPSNILIESIYIEKDKIELEVNINNSTMDRVNLYVALNKMNLFKKLEIESIKLDDTENKDTILLEIRNPQ